jgi:hypothetical protein
MQPHKILTNSRGGVQVFGTSKATNHWRLSGRSDFGAHMNDASLLLENLDADVSGVGAMQLRTHAHNAYRCGTCTRRDWECRNPDNARRCTRCREKTYRCRPPTDRDCAAGDELRQQRQQKQQDREHGRKQRTENLTSYACGRCTRHNWQCKDLDDLSRCIRCRSKGYDCVPPTDDDRTTGDRLKRDEPEKQQDREQGRTHYCGPCVRSIRRCDLEARARAGEVICNLCRVKKLECRLATNDDVIARKLANQSKVEHQRARRLEQRRKK